MRILPYRTLENMIDGVVITFVDITASKALEAELRKTQAGLYKQIGEQGLQLELRGRRPKEAGNTPEPDQTAVTPSQK
jgi:PAS domain